MNRLARQSNPSIAIFDVIQNFVINYGAHVFLYTLLLCDIVFIICNQALVKRLRSISLRSRNCDRVNHFTSARASLNIERLLTASFLQRV